MQAEQKRRFEEWAKDEGYDVAHTYDTERSRWVFLNPMTADLWNAWQACRASSPPAPTGALTVDDVRAVGGIVHSDGNIFFTNIDKLNKAIASKCVSAARTQALQEAYDAMFNINGCKVTRFDAQTAIRKLMEKQP